MRKLLAILPALVLFCSSCKKDQAPCSLTEEIRAIPISVSIERLEKAFFEASSPDDIRMLLDKYPTFSDSYLLENEFESKEALAEEIFKIHNDPGMQELYTEVVGHFPDTQQLEDDIEDAFKAISYYYPDFTPPKVYTYVSGFTTDIFLSEEILVIGLDFFLPSDHRFQPVELPTYMARRYDRDHLVPMIVTAISSAYNKTDLSDNTLLAEMIFYGKSYHFTKTILPCTPDEFIIGYTSEDVRASYANEKLIYAHFVENELFFETNPFVIRKYTGEAPFTDEISLDAPGRLGRWMGWNIVDDYQANADLTLQELMAEADAVTIFRQSGYKPR
nr:gliding motility lipoprotein GldB [Cytophagales bacterium]